jgi:hypothetical protein
MTTGGDYSWREGGRVVPAYAFTQGRTRTGSQELPLEALVTATECAVENLPTLQVEHRTIVRMSMRPTSVVEIGAALHLPAGVARVLVSDLSSAGFLVVHLPPPTDAVGGPRQEILERLLDGLRTRQGKPARCPGRRPTADPAQDPGGGRVRGREDHIRRVAVGDPAAEH